MYWNIFLFNTVHFPAPFSHTAESSHPAPRTGKSLGGNPELLAQIANDRFLLAHCTLSKPDFCLGRTNYNLPSNTNYWAVSSTVSTDSVSSVLISGFGFSGALGARVFPNNPVARVLSAVVIFIRVLQRLDLFLYHFFVSVFKGFSR